MTMQITNADERWTTNPDWSVTFTPRETDLRYMIVTFDGVEYRQTVTGQSTFTWTPPPGVFTKGTYTFVVCFNDLAGNSGKSLQDENIALPQPVISALTTKLITVDSVLEQSLSNFFIDNGKTQLLIDGDDNRTVHFDDRLPDDTDNGDWINGTVTLACLITTLTRSL